MELEPYLPVVEQALRTALKRGVTDPRQMALFMLDQLQVAIKMNPQAVLIKMPDEPTTPILNGKTNPITIETPQVVDVTQVFGSGKIKNESEADDRTPQERKEERREYLAEKAPVQYTKEIGEEGDKRKIVYQRQIVSPPDPMEFVELSYRIPGQDFASDPISGRPSGGMWPRVVVMDSGPSLNIKKYMDEIDAGIEALYRTKQAAPVQPRALPAVVLSDLNGAPSAETDASAGSEDLHRWGNPSASEFANLTEAQARARLKR